MVNIGIQPARRHLHAVDGEVQQAARTDDVKNVVDGLENSQKHGLLGLGRRAVLRVACRMNNGIEIEVQAVELGGCGEWEVNVKHMSVE